MNPRHGGLKPWAVGEETNVGILKDLEGFMVVDVAEPILDIGYEWAADRNMGYRNRAGLGLPFIIETHIQVVPAGHETGGLQFQQA